MDRLDKDFHIQANNALDAVVNSRSASADFLFTQDLTNGTRFHTFFGLPTARPLGMFLCGPSGSFKVTAGPLCFYRDRNCEGHYVVISVTEIEHQFGAVNSETFKAMSREIFALLSEAFKNAEGDATTFWGTDPNMFFDEIQDVMFTSPEPVCIGP